MADNPPDVSLFLAHAGTQSPAMKSGVTREQLVSALGRIDLPIVRVRPRKLGGWKGLRWGVLTLDSPEGARRLKAMDRLVSWRGKQTQEPIQVFRVGKEDVGNWVAQRLEPMLSYERPEFLLILGGPEEISFEVQASAAAFARVGRLSFDTDADYRAYANKVVAREEELQGRRLRPRGVFMAAWDGSEDDVAMALGVSSLMSPCVEAARRSQGAKLDDLRQIIGSGEKCHTALTEAVKSEAPTVLFSLSHGLGAPETGWGQVKEQRELQGNLVLGGGACLSAEDVRERSFLPGGIWFLFACFGAGTPARSAFVEVFERLRQVPGYAVPEAREVLEGLPRDGQPFVASLPKAALANPQGPLAVIGHVDLAWSVGFSQPGKPGSSRYDRIWDVLTTLFLNKRVGEAVESLRTRLSYSSDVVMGELRESPTWSLDGIRDETRRLQLLEEVMLCADLRSYVLLGDPAVELVPSKA